MTRCCCYCYGCYCSCVYVIPAQCLVCCCRFLFAVHLIRLETVYSPNNFLSPRCFTDVLIISIIGILFGMAEARLSNISTDDIRNTNVLAASILFFTFSHFISFSVRLCCCCFFSTFYFGSNSSLFLQSFKLNWNSIPLWPIPTEMSLACTLQNYFLVLTMSNHFSVFSFCYRSF